MTSVIRWLRGSSAFLIATWLACFPNVGVAAPPSNCASKFVGVWTYAGGTTRVNGDGTANPTCFMCVSVQTWTCSGNTYIITGPTSYSATLSADGRQMVGSAGIAVRVGGPAVAARPEARPETKEPKQARQQPSENETAKKPAQAVASNSANCSDITGTKDASTPRAGCTTGRAKSAVAKPPTEKRQDVTGPPAPVAPNGAPPGSPQIALAGKIIDELGRVRSGQANAPVPNATGASSEPGFDKKSADPYRARPPEPAPDTTRSCVPYFQTILKNFERNAALCLRDTRLLRSLTDMVENSKEVQTDRYVTRNSAPELFAYFDPLDPRWIMAGDKAYPNCNLPMTVASQSEAFMECARVYLCGAAAASCGLSRAETSGSNQCVPISQSCLAENPVPQQMTADPKAAPYKPKVQPAQAPSPPHRNSTITGPSGPGGTTSGGVKSAQ